MFCHGLFGQGRNWTGVAKALSDEYRSLLVDMPQHGRSPWSPEFDYPAMADQVAAALPEDGPVSVVGHSMGGKIAMLLALRHPEIVDRLVVVDISPVDVGPITDFARFVAAMRGVDLSGLQRRGDAKDAMAEGVPDPVIRGFLLQNLRHDADAAPGEQWRWQMNLDVLGDQLPTIGGWPADAVAGETYEGPVLWVAGGDSDYIRPEYQEQMAALFPHVRKVVVKGAGHWVHSEQPQVFVDVLRRFLATGG